MKENSSNKPVKKIKGSSRKTKNSFSGQRVQAEAKKPKDGKRTFKPGTMLNPVPVVLVSCGSQEGKANLITVAWTGIVNSNPPMTYISVRQSRHSHRILEEEKEFVINLVTKDLAFQTDFCGVRSGKDMDKFREMKLTPASCEIVSCPMVRESPVNLECKVVEIRSYPSHDMFVAEIVNVHVDEKLIDEKGRFALDRAGLISYSHGQYFALEKKPIGGFGYSVMKARTKKRKSREAALLKEQKKKPEKKNKETEKQKIGGAKRASQKEKD